MDFKVRYRVENKIFPAGLENVNFGGEVGERFDRFVHERTSGDFAINEILREAEECFAEQLDDEFDNGMWRGEFWGKLAISGAAIARMKRDAGLIEDLRESALAMLSYQREDGYLSTYRDNENIFKCTLERSQRKAPIGYDYNWNVWGQKYTLWGLLEIARLTDDEAILKGAAKMADNLIETVKALGVRLKDTGVMEGLAACSVMKPILILYRLTREERYLEFAQDIAASMDLESGERPNVLRNSRSGAPLSDWYSREDGWYAKAYECMSLLEGVAELYRITGEESLLRALICFWDSTYQYEANILGSVGYCEQLFHAKDYPDSATEVCDVIHWMRLSYELFAITGEEKYIKVVDKAFLNAFLAGVYEDGRWGAFFVRSAGRHYEADRQCDTKYQHCCLNNLGRGFANMAESIVMRGKDGYYVNSYIQSTTQHGDTLFRISKGYVDSGFVTVTVRGLAAGERVFLLIPEWSKNTVISVNGVKRDAECGCYNSVEIDSPDTVICIWFDMSVRICDFSGEYSEIPANDYHRQRWVESPGGFCDRGAMVYKPMSHVCRGPLLLARSKKIGSTESEMFSGETVCGKGATAEAAVLRHDRLLTLCRLTLSVEGEERVINMCDYASAANLSTQDGRFFSVFI